MSIVGDVERQVRERIAELKPLVDEYHQLQEVLRTFDKARSAGSRASSGPRVAFASGRRAQQALELVSANPGISVPEIADCMGIGPTYLYRVLPALERDGKVRKAGRGYQLA